MPHLGEVKWWDDSFVYVRCPECKNIHRHLHSRDYSASVQVGVAHCDSFIKNTRHLYGFRFPPQFEIDKQNGLYVASRANPSEPFTYDTELSDYLPQMCGLRRWVEADQKYCSAVGEEVELWFKLAMLAIPQEKIDVVRTYIEECSESDILVRGINAHVIEPATDSTFDAASSGTTRHVAKNTKLRGSGNTALHIAARWGDPATVQLLLDRGASPNMLNFAGRSPLAEAALWGRLGTVKVFVNNGADILMLCFRHGHHLRAADFAVYDTVNDEERNDRARQPFFGCQFPDRRYAEEINAERELITSLLNGNLVTKIPRTRTLDLRPRKQGPTPTTNDFVILGNKINRKTRAYSSRGVSL